MAPPLRYRLRDEDGVEVVVEGGRLVDPRLETELRLEVRGRLQAGLINAHDHLHRNHYPRLGFPPYRDAYAWGSDIHERAAHTIARAKQVDRRDALLFGALKNLIAGVTTVVHHDPWEVAFEDDFPIRVPPVLTVHSLGIEPGRAAAPPGDSSAPLCIHLAEGVTREMADEVREADRLGLLQRRLIAVHTVGVDRHGVDLLERRGVAVAWCPTSNHFLFGRTAPSDLLHRVDVVLGSDSLLTGAGTLLDELTEARRVGPLDDSRLMASVGVTAAARLALPRPSLAPGAPADLVAMTAPPLEASCDDVRLVIVAGRPRVADERYLELFTRLGIVPERLRVGAMERLVSPPLAAVAERILAEWPDAVRALGAPARGTPLPERSSRSSTATA